MIRKWKLLFVGVSCIMGTAMAQNNPILLFPKGAPGETTKLIEKADTEGGKTGGETVLRVTNVSEPTITVYPAPDEVATGAAVFTWSLPSSIPKCLKVTFSNSSPRLLLPRLSSVNMI